VNKIGDIKITKTNNHKKDVKKQRGGKSPATKKEQTSAEYNAEIERIRGNLRRIPRKTKANVSKQPVKNAKNAMRKNGLPAVIVDGWVK
jgi:hypothetical protein